MKFVFTDIIYVSNL